MDRIACDTDRRGMDGALDRMRRIALILLLSLFAFGCEDENMIVLMSNEAGGQREPSGDEAGPGTGEGDDPQSCGSEFEGVTVCVDAEFYSICHDRQWVKMPCPEGMACSGKACIESSGQSDGTPDPGENDGPSCGSDASCDVPEPCQQETTSAGGNLTNSSWNVSDCKKAETPAST